MLTAPLAGHALPALLLAGAFTAGCDSYMKAYESRAALYQNVKCPLVALRHVEPSVKALSRKYGLSYRARADAPGGVVFLTESRDADAKYLISGLSPYVSVSVFPKKATRPGQQQQLIFNEINALFRGCEFQESNTRPRAEPRPSPRVEARRREREAAQAARRSD